MNRKFVIADVFTETRFGGNQLAVFTDADGLDAGTMQNIAREMNYSETTFLLPPEGGGDYCVRIFTPYDELPFAGHPLVGSGYVIITELMEGLSTPSTSVSLETGVGLIPVVVETVNGRAGRSTMTQPIPQPREQFTDLPRLARALSLTPDEIPASSPAEVLFNGIPVLIVPATSLASVERIQIDMGALATISNEVGAKTILVFCQETVHRASTVHCRVFAPAEGILEDAATGSANGPLGVYLIRHKLIPATAVTRIVSEQGYEMKRPSTIYIDIDSDIETNRVTAVRVGGGVVITGRGEILL